MAERVCVGLLCVCVNENLRCVLKCYRAFSTFAGKYSTGEAQRRTPARRLLPASQSDCPPACLPAISTDALGWAK